MHSPSRNVVVLCSGFGLGFYIPGLLISEKLRCMGATAEVEVFESLLSENKIDMVEKSRRAYHANFDVALASLKVPSDIRESLNRPALELLLARWQGEDRRDFICLSGHWVPVLERYRELRKDVPIRADLLHLDADIAPSWSQFRKLRADYAMPYREVRLYDDVRMRVLYSVDVGGGPPLPYSARNDRLVVHGGGWGIGTFQEHISDLRHTEYALDIICYTRPDTVAATNGRRYFMDDPNWRTWHRNADGEHTFPPFGEVVSDSQTTSFARQTRRHGLYGRICGSLGIVSKPGAGTLIDSFSSATPVVMLEPFGPHEKRNEAVWEASGFGIPYRVWAAAGHPSSMLEELHVNLMEQRNSVKDYAQTFLARDAGE